MSNNKLTYQDTLKPGTVWYRAETTGIAPDGVTHYPNDHEGDFDHVIQQVSICVGRGGRLHRIHKIERLADGSVRSEVIS